MTGPGTGCQTFLTQANEVLQNDRGVDVCNSIDAAFLEKYKEADDVSAVGLDGLFARPFSTKI